MTVLDHGVLDDLERDLGDPDLVREVVQLYLNQLGQRRKAVVDAVDADDLLRVQREARTLASASAMIGATELRDLCRQLEYADVAPGELAGHPLVIAWPRLCDDIKTALIGWLAEG